jgi:hypothetical protein
MCVLPYLAKCFADELPSQVYKSSHPDLRKCTVLVKVLKCEWQKPATVNLSRNRMYRKGSYWPWESKKGSNGSERTQERQDPECCCHSTRLLRSCQLPTGHLPPQDRHQHWRTLSQGRTLLPLGIYVCLPDFSLKSHLSKPECTEHCHHSLGI